jgi:hypothetical protein
MPVIYVTVPVTMRKSPTVDQAIAYVKERGGEVFDVRTYASPIEARRRYREEIARCDGVLVVTPSREHVVGAGVAVEIEEALRQKKPVYIWVKGATKPQRFGRMEPVYLWKLLPAGTEQPQKQLPPAMQQPWQQMAEKWSQKPVLRPAQRRPQGPPQQRPVK